MLWKLSDKPVVEDNPDIANYPSLLRLTDEELRYLAYAFDPAEDNPFRNHVGYDKREAVIKKVTGMAVRWKDKEVPDRYQHRAAEYKRWQNTIREGQVDMRKAAVLYKKLSNNASVWMGNAYQDAMKNFAKLLKKDTNDPKLLALQINLAKEWPKLMTNQQQISEKVEEQQGSTPSKKQAEEKSTMSAWELAQAAIEQAEKGESVGEDVDVEEEDDDE